MVSIVGSSFKQVFLIKSHVESNNTGLDPQVSNKRRDCPETTRLHVWSRTAGESSDDLFVKSDCLWARHWSRPAFSLWVFLDKMTRLCWVYAKSSWVLALAWRCSWECSSSFEYDIDQMFSNQSKKQKAASSHIFFLVFEDLNLESQQ